MNKKVTKFYLSFLVIPVSLLANPTNSPNSAVPSTVKQNNEIHGKVLDKQTKETLAGAVITANGQKVYTDLDGNFAITNLCGEKCQLKISLISYEDLLIDVDVNKDQQLQVKLQQR